MIGKWARTKLSGQQTLIERNYTDRGVPPVGIVVPADDALAGATRSQ